MLTESETLLAETAYVQLELITNSHLRKRAGDILGDIHVSIVALARSDKGSYALPRLHAQFVKDQFLIEWIFDDYRIGFSVEENADDSGWYIVSKATLGGITASGHLSHEPLDSDLVLWIVSFPFSRFGEK